MRRNRSLVTRNKGSQNWRCNFTVKGHRFRRSLKTDSRKVAEALAAKMIVDALLDKLTDERSERPSEHYKDER
jgi:hypothetical protein